MKNKNTITPPFQWKGVITLFYNHKNKLRSLIFKKVFFFIFLIICSTNIFSQKEYIKNYYSNGNLEKEGWFVDGKKNGYWKFYYSNGTLKKEGKYKKNFASKYWYFYRKNSYKEKEGHFVNGKQNKWWLYYNKEGEVNHKCQLKDNQKNGYCLLYQKRKLIKAVKFKNGKKLKEWTSFSSFKDENNMSDLK